MVTAEFEYMCRILNDVDVDVSAFERINAGSCVNRIFILYDLESSIAMVRAHLIPTKIVHIEQIGLAGFPRDYAYPFHVWASKSTRWQ